MNADAYPRDASLWTNPGRAFALHFDRGDGWSACGAAVLDAAGRRDANDVPEVLRCARGGCRQRWDGAAK